MVEKQSKKCFIQTAYLKNMLSIIMTVLLVTLSCQLHADTVTASLNKDVVTENEIVQLTLRADFNDTANGPDLTPLKRDFEIIGQSQNSQFRFNLGTSTALKFWVISLMPKSVGTFEIPPISIGNQASQPINLVVKNSPQLLDQNGNPPVIMKAEVSEVEPYLQQQIIITIQLYTSVALQNANRSVPEHPDLVIESLIDDQMHYENVNGTQYQVITREFIAFPQRSGSLVIPPQTIQAMVNTSTGRRLIKVQSEPINLKVLPIPASYVSDFWLPSDKVSVRTSLEKTTDNPRVGDTLIWHIEIQAEGALPEQILTPNYDSTNRYKLYPKPAKFSTRKTGKGITGQQSISIEVVPTAAGTLTLPEVEIPYWNVESRALEIASSSTTSIQIASLPNTSSPVETKPEEKTLAEPLPSQPRSVAPISLAKPDSPKEEASKAEAQPISTITNQEDPEPIQVTLTTSDTNTSWRNYLTGILLIIATSAIGVWLYIRYKKKPNIEAESQVPTLQEFAPLSTENEESAYFYLIECCQQNNLAELRVSLLEWARHRWGDEEIHSVNDIKRLTSMQVTQLLMETELMMYSNSSAHEWQGGPLAEALEEFVSGESKPSQASQLKALYPDL